MKPLDKQSKQEEKDLKKVMKAEKKKAKKEAYQALDPAKKKKIKRRKIMISVVAVIVVFFLVSKVLAGNTAMPVMTQTVGKGTVEASLSTSGTVKSEEVKSYFSTVDSKVGEIKAKLGDPVKKGDIVFTYDENEITLAMQKAELEARSSQKGYEATATDNAKYQNQLTVSLNDSAQIKALMDQQEVLVQELEDSISDEVVKKRAALYDKQYQIQVNINNHQHQLALSSPGSSEYLNTQDNLYKLQADLQKVTNDLSLLQDYKSKDNKEETLRKAQKDLTDMKTMYEETKADKNAAKNSVANGAKIEQAKASSAITTIEAQNRYEKLSAVQNGVTAEFNGIITELSVVEGTPVASAGTKLFTLESSENVKVEITVSKYDLEQLKVGQTASIVIAGNTYEGKVTKINRMATPNASGTPVVATEIHINNPDDAVYLGVEAKVNIDTAKAEDVITIPIEAVNADKEGDFCYVVENGSIVRKDVVVGISSDQLMEIKEGLKEGDQIVVGSTNGISEGMKVTPIPQQ